MHNYQLIIEYDGKNFVGWQFQKNGKSVQEVLETNLKRLLKKKVKDFNHLQIKVKNLIAVYSKKLQRYIKQD